MYSGRGSTLKKKKELLNKLNTESLTRCATEARTKPPREVQLLDERLDRPAHNGMVFKSVFRLRHHLSKMAFVPSFVNFLVLVEALIGLFKFSASLNYTFIVASHIDRSLSSRSKPKCLSSFWNLDQISFWNCRCRRTISNRKLYWDEKLSFSSKYSFQD